MMPLRPIKETLSGYYWILIALLSGLNVTTIFFGFHPHHDGLMLSTIRLTKDNLLNGGPYPFNQYGSFWTVPYLLVSLITPSSFLMISMRIVTFLFYFLVCVFTYKTAAHFANVRVSKFSVLILLLAHPIGLEPLPWPSSVSMFLTIYLTWLILVRHPERQNKSSNYILVLAGVVATMNILTRAQVGLLSIIGILVYFRISNRKGTRYFIFGVIGFSATYGLILQTMGWLGDSLSDEFLFGWTVASSSLTDRTFPKSSLLVLVLLVILYIFVHSSTRFTRVKARIVFSTIYGLSFGLFLIRLGSGDFSTLIGKVWVAIVLFACFLTLWFMAQAISRKNFGLVLLSFFGLAAAAQIYPLFDVMHAWWGITPVVIILGIALEKLFSRYQITKVPAIPVLAISLILVSSQLNAVFRPSQEVSASDLKLIRLDSQSHASYQMENDFYRENIPQGSSVLNLCPDGRIFFSPNFVHSETRFFVYWPTMYYSATIQKAFMNSNPDYVLFCSISDFELNNKILKKFTTPPYEFKSQYSDGKSQLALWEKN